MAKTNNIKLDIINHLSKIFDENEKGEPGDLTDRIPDEDLKMFLDPTQTIGIIPKYYSLRNTLLINFNVGGEKICQELLKTDYNDLEITDHFTYISPAILRPVIELIKTCKYGQVAIRVHPEKPARFENEFFIIFIAPRIEDWANNLYPFKSLTKEEKEKELKKAKN
jgi:hypothetical protein